ncbi:MAG: hypothetical protein LH477_16710 [Nocardioides sp.]|nr:hypothetical protein [Nocardioides sp.]
MTDPRPTRLVLRRAVIGVLVLVVSTFLVMLLADTNPTTAGPVWPLTNSHGLHLSDLPLLALWAIAMAGAAYLWRDAGE